MRALLTCILLAMPFCFVAQPQLSSKATISLLSCSSGNELYSTFGHSGVRVSDMRNGVIIDSVYNYGTFDFNQPNFYLNFARGKLNYSLSRQPFPWFQYEYIFEGRGMQEQVLNLDSAQKQSLYEALLLNYQPENRDYKYDFFFDNCSTRIRDIVANETGDVHYETAIEPITFRELIQLYLNDMPWGDFGIDLALGMPCDRYSEDGEQMFLPDFLYDVFGKSQIGEEPLVAIDTMLLGKEDRPVEHLPLSPMGATLIYLAVTIISIALSRFKPIFGKIIFRFHLLVSGLIGLMLTLLWFATDHTITAQNFNLLWAWPLNLVLLFSSFKARWTHAYLMIFVAVQLITLMFWSVWPQDLHEALIPLVIAHLLSGLVFLLKYRTKA